MICLPKQAKARHTVPQSGVTLLNPMAHDCVDRNPYVVSRQGVGICVRLLTISVDCGWDYSQSQRIGRFLYIPFVP